MKTNSNLEFRKIKSLDFLYEINENGTILRNVKSKKQLKIALDMHHSKTGYYRSTVHIHGVIKRVNIHTLVAECWLGDRPEGLEIDHIDRNSKNNDYRNLRYVTRSEQMKNRVLPKELIETAKRNCLNHSINDLAKKVTLKNEKEVLEFRSIMKTSEFLSEKTGKTIESVRWKLKNRRHHVFGYDVIYGM